MASPLSDDRLLRALRAEGCRVREVRSWRTHNRDHMGPWGPINGVMIHHTVTRGSARTVDLCYDGYASLPGPLCHGVITKDGTVHLISNGRANHAGGGDPAVLAAVRAEDYGTTPPGPNRGNANGVDGNRHFYGFECENLGDGKDPWPPEQLDGIERASAAICRAYGWGAKSTIGHLEWSSDKIDPRGFGMPGMRERIAARLRRPAGEDSSPDNPMGDDVPHYLSLGRTTWMTLKPGQWNAIEFDEEWSDSGGYHYQPGGSQFAKGKCQFTGQIGVRVDGLPEGEFLQIMLSEVDRDTGKYIKNHDIDELIGSPGDAFRTAPVNGLLLDTGKGMRVRLLNQHTADVRIKAYMKVHIWDR